MSKTLTWELYQDSLIVLDSVIDSTVADAVYLEELWMGGYFPDFVGSDFDFRNVKVGTTQGDDDIWAPTISGAVVPPFDSIVGDPTDITATGDTVTVLAPGDPDYFDVYALEDLGGSLEEIWLRWDIRFRAAQLAGISPLVATISDTSAGRIMGFYFDGIEEEWGKIGPTGGGGGWSQPNTPVVLADTWYTMDAHWLLGAPAVITGPVFDGGAAFRAV